MRNYAFNVVSVYIRVTQIKTYSWDNAQVVLVGNKCDLENERVVAHERGKQFADHLGAYNSNRASDLITI